MDKSRILAAVAAVLAVTLAACTQTAEPPGTAQTPVPTEPSTAVPDPDPDVDAPILYWNDSSRTTELGNGFTASACPGDAPLLCVFKDGEQVGYLEALAFPIESFPDLDPDGDTDTTLARFADGFFDDMAADRATGCGTDYVFERIDPEPIVLGNTPGIVFGFAGSMPNGDPSEYNLQYATIVGDTILTTVAAAYDEGGCPGRDELSGFRSADLIELRPHLEPALYESPLPHHGA